LILVLTPARWRQQSDSDNDGYDPLADELSSEDWDQVEGLANFLEPFHQMTLRLEGNTSKSGFGSLWQTLPNLQHLWHELHKKQRLVTGNSDPTAQYIDSAIKLGVEKLSTYFTKLVMEPEVSYYCVATFLNPRLRALWFKDKWASFPDWYRKADRSVKTVYEAYEAQESDNDEEEDREPESPTRRKGPGGEYHDNDYEETLGVDLYLQTGSRSSFKKPRIANQIQKYNDDIYVDLHTAKPTDSIYTCPFAWWIEIGQARYPLLFKIAMDFLSIPCTSCECERCFSRARRTISADRCSLSPTTIEALQLQRNWLQNKAVSSDLISLTDFIAKRSTLGFCQPSQSSTRANTPSVSSVAAATDQNSSFTSQR
jgi:hypothetical protein